MKQASTKTPSELLYAKIVSLDEYKTVQLNPTAQIVRLENTHLTLVALNARSVLWDDQKVNVVVNPRERVLQFASDEFQKNCGTRERVRSSA